MTDTPEKDDLPEADAQVDQQDAPDPAQDAEAEAARKETEAEARKYGWRPRESFDLAPEVWVDADRFLELPSTQNKALRASMREMQAKLDEAEKARQRDLEAVRRTAQTAIEKARQQEEARYAQELEAIRLGKMQAVKAADTARFDQLEQHEARLRQQAAQPQPQVYPEIQDYRAKNEWTNDPVLWHEATQAVDIALRSGVQFSSPADQVAFAEKHMSRKYPHMFRPAQPAAPAQSRVDAGGLGGGFRRGKTAADLPADIRAVAQDFVKEGVFKSVDDYAREYFEQG